MHFQLCQYGTMSGHRHDRTLETARTVRGDVWTPFGGEHSIACLAGSLNRCVVGHTVHADDVTTSGYTDTCVISRKRH